MEMTVARVAWALYDRLYKPGLKNSETEKREHVNERLYRSEV